jgi:hypothetical protein
MQPATHHCAATVTSRDEFSFMDTQYVMLSWNCVILSTKSNVTIALMMEAGSTFETSVGFHGVTRFDIPKACSLSGQQGVRAHLCGLLARLPAAALLSCMPSNCSSTTHLTSVFACPPHYTAWRVSWLRAESQPLSDTGRSVTMHVASQYTTPRCRDEESWQPCYHRNAQMLSGYSDNCVYHLI